MRRYTGFNGVAAGPAPAMVRLTQYAEFLTGNGLWNNGIYGNRPMRGKKSTSVHATGRAADWSWRKMPETKTRPERGFGDYWPAKAFIDTLIEFQELFLLEAVLDYHGEPYGQGWRCDRDAWQQYDRKTIAGAPGGDWFHIEISPRRANDPTYIDKAFEHIFSLLA